jgi:predicted flap endonuclease-1-like 5' DNA nuclease
VIPAGAKVQEIRVNAGLYVDGFQLVYVDAAGVVTELPHLGGKGGWHHTFALDGDEYLTGISGRSGRYIDSLCFHTNKRTMDKVGGSGGDDEFHYEAAVNGEVAGFFGRADWLIDNLGVIVRDRAGATVPAAAPAVPAPSAVEAPAAAIAKPATKSRKKTAPAADLVGIPDSPPVTPPAPDLVGLPDSGAVLPPAPDLVAIPNSGTVEPTPPELVGIPGSAPTQAAGVRLRPPKSAQNEETSTGTQADDLTRIEGIGPKVAQVLGDAGITTFAALAGTEVTQLRQILDSAGSRYRLTDPTTWPEQAAHAARGDWQAFNDLVARLKAGRRA